MQLVALYGLTRREIRELEQSIAKIDRLPAVLNHPALTRMVEQDK